MSLSECSRASRSCACCGGGGDCGGWTVGWSIVHVDGVCGVRAREAQCWVGRGGFKIYLYRVRCVPYLMKVTLVHCESRSRGSARRGGVVVCVCVCVCVCVRVLRVVCMAGPHLCNALVSETPRRTEVQCLELWWWWRLLFLWWCWQWWWCVGDVGGG